MEPLLATFFGLALLALPPTANPACTEEIARSGVLNVYRVPARKCSVVISGKEIGPRSRSYVFSETGSLLVFNSFGTSGSVSRDTGARNYFLFPRRGLPSFYVESDSTVTVTAANGQAVRYSPADGSILAFSGVKFQEDPVISAENHGGLEIEPLSTLAGFILDTGWEVGKVAYTHRDWTSKFIFPEAEPSHARSCIVRNDEIFDYSEPWNPKLRFEQDEELLAFVRARCPSSHSAHPRSP